MSRTGIIAVSIPLFVTVIVCAIARSEGSLLPTGSLVRLAIATAGALAGVWLYPDPGVALVIALALFVVFVTPVTRAIERSALPGITNPIRTADLSPRAIATYIPLAARALLVIAALGLLVWVGGHVLPERVPVMTAGFTFAGLAFFGLYETWIRQEVFAVRATDDAERRSRVRALFAAQFVLTIGFLFMGGLAARPWPGFVPLAVIATLLGSLGCGLALSTGVQQRFLEASAARGSDG